MHPAEVEQILGLPSEMREIMDEVTCRFHFKPAGPPKPAGEETFIDVRGVDVEDEARRLQQLNSARRRGRENQTHASIIALMAGTRR